MKNFWFITLCVLLIFAAVFGLNFPLRVAIGANAILILMDVIRQIRRLYNGKTEKEK